MDEQPAPAPKPQPAAPHASTDGRVSAAYTAPPPAPARARRWGPLALIAALAFGGVGVGIRRRSAPVSAPAAVVQTDSPALRGTAGRVYRYKQFLPSIYSSGGDVYEITVDGAVVRRFTPRPGWTVEAVELDTSKPHVVAQTRVFTMPRDVDVKPTPIDPLPASFAQAAAAADADSTPKKASRCTVELTYDGGKTTTQIGDFPCDCEAVRWTGNVGACSLTK